MKGKHKVTYTLYVDDPDDRKSIDRKLIARRIRSTALRKGEKFSEWAKEMGITRQMVSQVVNGRQKTGWVRDFIESRLGIRFWDNAV